MNKSLSTVAVHGATGTQGGAIVARLLDMGAGVRALSRRGTAVPGAEGVAVDLADTASLVTAYEGVDTVVVNLPLEFRAEPARRHADAVLTALAKASVRRAVLMANGPLPAAPTGVPFVDARRLVATELTNAVPEPRVVGAAGIFLQNLAAPWSLPLLRGGVAAYPLPAEAPVPWLDVADVADEIGEILAHGGPAARAVTGPDELTGDELVAALRPVFGSVEWRTVTPTEYAAMLAPHLGHHAAEGIAAMYAAPPYPALDAPVVRGRTTVLEWARALESNRRR